MSECWKFQVEGRVQGVWFRESTRRQAEWLQHGPPMAEVKTVSHVPFAGICPTRFTAR
jgi:hypothetical protein